MGLSVVLLALHLLVAHHAVFEVDNRSIAGLDLSVDSIADHLGLEVTVSCVIVVLLIFLNIGYIFIIGYFGRDFPNIVNLWGLIWHC